jgi:hypothetical protein
MERFIGVKEIKAKPMTLGEYNKYRGWEIPADEDPTKAGYLVEYLDGGQPNHPEHSGYISWSPADVFDRAYKPVSGMTFGLAIEAMKKGHKVCRAGWNGKDMWIAHMSGMELPPYSTQGTYRKVNDRTARLIGEDTPLTTLPYIAMWTADKKWLPGWLASQTDMLAEDWMIVE